MITYISPINMVAEDNHLYFAYKSPLGYIGFRVIFEQSILDDKKIQFVSIHCNMLSTMTLNSY